MKKIIIFILLPFFVFSQETNISTLKASKNNIVGKISGKIKSIEDKSNLEFASVSLFRSNNKDLIEGTITDSKGRFIFKDVITGSYILKISFIGFESKEIIFSTNKLEPNFQNNNIYLDIDSKLLEEINIKDEKAIYETRIDKIVYNAENDLNDAENDATDVLRKAPLLSVDLEGNVTLRGSKNIKFLVNGKASSFFSSDVSTALQMIPAAEIKKVEVITSPGAKYEGEGDAGIVNIITKKTIIDGTNNTYRVTNMFEKPNSRDLIEFTDDRVNPNNLPGFMAIVGRYILTPDIFDILKKTKPGKNGEIQVTDALLSQARQGKVIAYKFKGKRFDCGSVEGYLGATNHFAKKLFKI